MSTRRCCAVRHRETRSIRRSSLLRWAFEAAEAGRLTSFNTEVIPKGVTRQLFPLLALTLLWTLQRRQGRMESVGRKRMVRIMPSIQDGEKNPLFPPLKTAID